MEARDLELIEKHSPANSELKVLWDQHKEFEALLGKLEAKAFRTPTQELDIKEIKKKKLAGKTKIMAILDGYKRQGG